MIDKTQLQIPGSVLRVIRVIDVLTERFVDVVAVLMLPLILGNVVEVFMRYVMNTPTTWVADMTVMTYGSLFMLGASYGMLKGAHVRTDIFWDGFSARTRGIIDSVSYLLLFLPVMVLIFAISIDDVFYAYSIDERSILGLWHPVIWPFRAVIPLSAFLLFAQGLSELLKALWQARTGTEMVKQEKFEL